MKGNLFYILIVAVVVLYFGGRYIYFKPKFINGESVPAIRAQTIHGSQFDLEQLRGRYVLVDFWGSWCGPCRAENPQLVAFESKYSAKTFQDADGFDVVSVAVETDERRWRAAIEKDGLDWPYHIGQFERFDSPVVKEFGVREVPTKYLLNPDGQIIGVNLTFEEMDRLLSDRIAG